MKNRKILVSRLLVLCAALLCVLLPALPCLPHVPILMYHHIAADASNSMIVTPERFCEDMEFLQANGYTALLPSDLDKIAHYQKWMPAKPVVITFDDGYASNYTYAYPILRQTGMKAAIALIVSHIRDDGAPDAYNLNWAQCREMTDSGLVELGCHTYALHNEDNGGNPYPDGHDGVLRKDNETETAYRTRVGGDLQRGLDTIRQKTGHPCTYFSYPFGARDLWDVPLLRAAGVRVTTTTEQRSATLRRGLYALPRLRITMEKPLSDVLS